MHSRPDVSTLQSSVFVRSQLTFLLIHRANDVIPRVFKEQHRQIIPDEDTRLEYRNIESRMQIGWAVYSFKHNQSSEENIKLFVGAELTQKEISRSKKISQLQLVDKSGKLIFLVWINSNFGF